MNGATGRGERQTVSPLAPACLHRYHRQPRCPSKPFIPPPVPAAHTLGCCCTVTIYTPSTSARPQNSRTQEPTRGAGDAHEFSPSIPRRAGCSRYLLPAATNAQTAQLSDKCPVTGTAPRAAEFSEHAPNAKSGSQAPLPEVNQGSSLPLVTAREHRPPPPNSDRVICSKRNPRSLEEETPGLRQSAHLCTFPQRVLLFANSVQNRRAPQNSGGEIHATIETVVPIFSTTTLKNISVQPASPLL